jgi:hypothetical protein
MITLGKSEQPIANMVELSDCRSEHRNFVITDS